MLLILACVFESHRDGRGVWVQFRQSVSNNQIENYALTKTVNFLATMNDLFQFECVVSSFFA